MNKLILFLVAMLPLFLTSCATYHNNATGRNEIMFISPGAEANIGRNMNTKVASQYEVSNDPAYLKRINAVGARLVKNIPARGIPYTFGVVKDKNMNAFTFPGGYVYATSGLMDRVKSDDELAAVLAHEIGHTEARHAVKQMEGAIGYTSFMSLASALDPRDKEKKDAEWKYLKTGTDVVFSLVNLGYSRKDEYEADRLSVKFLPMAGYDPKAILSFFEKLKQETGSKTPEWLYFLRSHPFLDERIVAARAEIDKGTSPVLEVKKPN
ncbi:MAG: M48 family metalloprotease [Candidatus Omnitrophica bacterium]|nr:M48 family metalloprotease [Candidatus Omnitrophota bacterium]